MRTNINEYKDRIAEIIKEFQEPGISYFVILSQPKNIEIEKGGVIKKEVQLIGGYAIHPSNDIQDKKRFMDTLVKTGEHLANEIFEGADK